MSVTPSREVEADRPRRPDPRAPLAARSRKARPRPELIVEYVFGPLARLIVAVLLPLRVPPPAVVLANTAAGLAGAWAIWHGDLLAAALLLQLKTLLDNADGQLARAAGRTSTLGRYLDTEADAVVNIAVFVSLAHVTGLPWLALGAFVALTLVLSVDFNLEAMYRAARGEQFRPPPDELTESRVARALTAVYDAVFGPQDRAARSLARRRLDRVLRGARDPAVRERATLAYHDGATVAVLVNLGLSTQLAVLGLCLALDAPAAYLWFALACGLLVPVLWVRRERRARAALVTG
jgi:archaetidylinositol phosphate synthase